MTTSRHRAVFRDPDIQQILEQRIRERIRQLSEHAPVSPELVDMVTEQELKRAAGGLTDEAG